MSDRPDPAAIARGLSKAQREAFARGTDLGFVPVNRLQRNAFIDKGLALLCDPYSKAMNWTPFGQQVRAYLESSDAGA